MIRFKNISGRITYQRYEGYAPNQKSCELIVSVNKPRFWCFVIWNLSRESLGCISYESTLHALVETMVKKEEKDSGRRRFLRKLGLSKQLFTSYYTNHNIAAFQILQVAHHFCARNFLFRTRYPSLLVWMWHVRRNGNLGYAVALHYIQFSTLLHGSL